MAKFALRPGEQLVMEGSVPYLKSRLQFVTGRAHLTDQRLVHTDNRRAQAVGGLVGGLMKGRVDLDIPLGAIVRVARGAHGRKQEPVLVVTTEEGTDHRLVAPFDEWFAALDRTLSSTHATRLVELEPDTWAAVPQEARR